MQDRYSYYEQILDNVDAAVDLIRAVPAANCFDAAYLEHDLIPRLGLNNEMMAQQPPELVPFSGKGLHIWQYPSQLSRFLVWLTFNARDVGSYMEIGARWGGTFILVAEWLRKTSPNMAFAVGVDPIDESPFIRRYREIAGYPVLYRQEYSTSREFIAFANTAKPEVVFIDGDHSMGGVMTDHANARNYARIIAHHDISSDLCRYTTTFWQYLRLAEDRFSWAEFTQQYPSLEGRFLGIGALLRRPQQG